MILKKLFLPIDMTKGKPWVVISAFAIPMLIGNLAQQLYATVDSIVVGQYVGDNALAAVGAASPMFNMLIVLFVGISTGAGILVAQYCGAKKREELAFIIGNSMALMFISSLIIMAMAPFVIMPLLEMLNTPDSIIKWAHDYLFIQMIGIAGLAFYNILNGILRGLGDSFSALLYLMIATVLNIVLDLYFVIELNMGVAGVSLATVIAQSVSALFCIRRVLTLKSEFDLKPRHLLLHRTHVRDIIKLGLPSGLTQAIFSMAMVIVQSLSNSYGELFIGANVVVMRVDGFAIMPIFSFGAALTTYAGQNMGAGNTKRILTGAKQGNWLSLAVAGCITLGIIVFCDPLIRLFTNTEELIAMSRQLLYILAPGYIAFALMQAMYGTMRGIGDTMTPMYISILTSVVLRVPLAYLFSYLSTTEELPYGRYESVHVSLLISWLLGAFVTIWFYKKGKWRKVLMEEKNDELALKE